MKALSFLGTSDYKTVAYCWSGAEKQQACQTHLFPEAVARIFQPDKLLVLVTPQVKEHGNFLTLCERLGELVQPVDIPEGKSPEDLWVVFSRCAEAVGHHDEIVLDVTHAFRSLPLIVFAVAAYLRCTKDVAVCHIVYGAYEARVPFRDPPEPADQAPVFDLTPLLDLLDWLSGAEAFLLRSDAEMLRRRLVETHRHLWTAGAENELPRHLQTMGTKLQSLSRALHLSRPLDVMRGANELLPILEAVGAEAKRWAQPFAVLLEEVRTEMEPLVHQTPERLDGDNLRKQLALIEHYLQKGLIVQAVTLSRKWVVSWVVLHRGEGDWLDKRFREEEVEKALGVVARRERGEEAEVPGWFEGLPQSREVARLWGWLTPLRNDLAHCGMSRQAASAQSIGQQANEVPQRLQKLLDAISNR